MKNKIFIIGHARHGKDTVAELLAPEYTYTSSSLFCAKKFIFEALKDKYGYATLEDCFNDRGNHRAEWFNMIVEYNASNPARLAIDIFEENDIYVGLRNVKELDHYLQFYNKDVSAVVIWVDACKRLPLEDPSSISVSVDDANFVIDNNGSYEDLVNNVKEIKHLFRVIGIN